MMKRLEVTVILLTNAEHTIVKSFKENKNHKEITVYNSEKKKTSMFWVTVKKGFKNQKLTEHRIKGKMVF